MKQDAHLLESIVTDLGNNLFSLSKERPILLIFLRHFGCMFCRNAMKEIAAKREEWEKRGVKIVLTHLSDPEVAKVFFEEYGLAGLESISNPDCDVYEKLGLMKGSFNQLFGLQNWIRGYQVAVEGELPSLKIIGDGFQMPGIFLVHEGQIKDSYIHKYASDKPDYEKLLACCVE